MINRYLVHSLTVSRHLSRVATIRIDRNSKNDTVQALYGETSKLGHSWTEAMPSGLRVQVSNDIQAHCPLDISSYFCR